MVEHRSPKPRVGGSSPSRPAIESIMKDKILNYLKETRAELRQVTWPTKAELIGSTIVTIVTTLVLAVFIYGVDKILETLILSILNLKS